MTSFEYERIPFLVVFEERSAFKDTYGGEIGRIALHAQLIRPRNRPSKTALLFMHPIGGGAYLPLMSALAKQGCHVIYCDSRYRGADSALIMEKVVVDLGAAVRSAKEKHGYEKVVLGGWSGGGSLSLYYQAQAEKPTVAHTPAGDPPDLTIQDLTPADGVILVAAHVARNLTLTEWLDASILDETDPTKRDSELNIYDPHNPNRPPFSLEYIDRYRNAQIARNRRITNWVKSKLNEFKDTGRTNQEFGFVIHGTMADLRWVDPTVDPNDRKSNWCYLGDPEVVNMSPVGLARFCTLRSWLSQWSYDDSLASGITSANKISVPALVVGNSADDACTPEHTNRLYDAIGHSNKLKKEIKGANHYFFGQPELAAEAATECIDWMQSQALIEGL